MKYPFFVLLLLSHFTLVAQSVNKKLPKYGMSVSYELLRSTIDAIHSADSTSHLATSTAFSGFNLGFQIYDKKAKNYHDISLSRFYYTIMRSGYIKGAASDSSNLFATQPLNFQIGVKYAYFLRLTKKEKKSKFLLEFPMEVFYHRWVGYDQSFYKASNTLGLNIGVTPHYQYYF